MRDDIKNIIERLSPAIADEGCDLVDAEILFESGRKILRLYIDKVGGVTLGDCTKVSHAVGDFIDVEELVSGVYNLEVSSPGLNRPLRTVIHFQSVIGKLVEFSTKEKINNRRNYKGILIDANDSDLKIKIDGQDFLVPFVEVQKARLVADI